MWVQLWCYTSTSIENGGLFSIHWRWEGCYCPIRNISEFQYILKIMQNRHRRKWQENELRTVHSCRHVSLLGKFTVSKRMNGVYSPAAAFRNEKWIGKVSYISSKCSTYIRWDACRSLTGLKRGSCWNDSYTQRMNCKATKVTERGQATAGVYC